MVVNKTAAS